MFNVKSSPIFNLSMASKELFHSNMLYWISTTYHAQFISSQRKKVDNKVLLPTINMERSSFINM